MMVQGIGCLTGDGRSDAIPLVVGIGMYMKVSRKMMKQEGIYKRFVESRALAAS